MNFPNILSIIRIMIAVTVPYLLISGNMEIRLVAGVAMVVAAFTDWLDGWYARKYNKITTLGKILDPIADKALVLILFSVFVYMDVISIWWIIPIFVREIVVTVYRFIFLSKKIVVAAAKSGKIKTVMQMFTLGLVYVFFMTDNHFKDYFSDYFTIILRIALTITLYLTIKSGYLFFKNNWHLIKRYHEIS